MNVARIRSPLSRLLAVAFFCMLASMPAALGAQDLATPAIQTFLNTDCTECHGPEKQKAERRFDQLALPVVKADTLIEIQDIIDQLNLGEMPPEKAKKHPVPTEVAAVVAHLTQLASDAQVRLASTGGQTVLRRLNRREYLNTVGDLFALNMTMFDPTTKFPRDQSVQHMDNIGDALKTSGYLLAQYVEAADQIVEKALSPSAPPAERTWRFTNNFQQQGELRSHGKVHNFRFMALYESPQSIRHEGAYGPLLAFAQGVPADGYYEIRVKAEAKNRRHPYDPKIFETDPEMPFRLGIVAGQAKVGPLYQPQPIEPQLGEAILKDEVAEWHTFRVWLDRGFTPRFTFPNGTLSIRPVWNRILRQYNSSFPPSVRATTGIVGAREEVQRHGFVPQIRIHEVEIRGPLNPAWPTTSQRTILGDQPFTPDRTREILTTFATRAYRRPVLPNEIDRLMAVVDRRQQSGQTPFDALKDGLKTVLCSPAFLYLAEPSPDSPAAPADRSLNAHALAARLSYFLWSTTPDPELTRSANTGELLRPDVLLAQTRRLLASPRANAFVHGLLDSWLNLRTLGDMAPDRGTFVRYYADDLQSAMKRETQLFTRDLLDRNVSIARFLDADYTFVNRPLARLYGLPTAIDGATGHEFRRVPVAPQQRGGLLGQASVLTVSANGVETSPVIRGVWLLDNILGTPPAPPPDNVPPIDPDIRGAKSMRDILTKHRDNPSCYECHRKIDPLGFALERFNPIGEWRETYEKKVPIDTSGELPGGQHFADVAGLKQALVERKSQFARMLTERLLTYACGRRVEPLDRPAIDAILEATKPNAYPFRDLIEHVVLSPTFRSK